MPLFGQNLIDPGLKQIKYYAEAQNKIVKAFLAGERDEWLDIVDMAYHHVNIPRIVDGYEMNLVQSQRVVSWIERGEAYPRIGEETTSQYYLRPRKMGGMSESYLEDLIGKPPEMIALKTSERMNLLMKDFMLSRLERGMITLNDAVTAGGTTYQYDCSSGNLVTDFTTAMLQDVITKRKQNKPGDNMSEWFIVMPPDVENQLRKDSAFDNSDRLATDLLVNGQLPQTLMGIGKIFVTNQMPVLYDSGGNMLDAGAAPTGVYKLPIQFTDSPGLLPKWLAEGAVAASEWDEDKVARCVWLIEKNQAGIYLTQDMPPEFPAVEMNLKDNSYDSIGMKIRGMINFGCPLDVRGFGLTSLIRAGNIRLRTIA